MAKNTHPLSDEAEFRRTVSAQAKNLGELYDPKCLKEDHANFLRMARALDYTPDADAVSPVPPSRPVVRIEEGRLVIDVHAAPKHP